MTMTLLAVTSRGYDAVAFVLDSNSCILSARLQKDSAHSHGFTEVGSQTLT